MDNFRSHIAQIFGTVLSATGTLAAWQAQIDWALRVSASLVAIISGALVIRSLLRAEKKK